MITFYTQALGSSHLASKKPCQDNGAHYNDDKVCIAIVCDGHGGESYVRSDAGSRIAAKVAKDKILEFVKSIPAEIFAGKKNAVTVVPTRDPSLDKQGHKRSYSMLSESEIEILKQNALHTKAVEKHPETETLFRKLFKEIYESWKSEIEDDARTNPFSNREKAKCDPSRIEKAYGTTLMAAVRTPDYWFAFHIGDGRLYACNKQMKWYEPVPWDCECFLNTTTSLCDYAPDKEFRYAFDGTGNFPVAFVLGSDGIDDSLVKTELIHKFYSQLLCKFNELEQEDANNWLKELLSRMSERGSHDDMSIATIIDESYLPTAAKYFEIHFEINSLEDERGKRQDEIRDLAEKIGTTQKELDKIEIRRKEVSEQLQKLSDELDKTNEALLKFQKDKEDSEKEFSRWENESHKRLEELRESAEAIIKSYNNNMDNVSTVEDSCTEQTSSINDLCIADDKGADSPNDVYKKAAEARMSEEGIAQMDREAEEQTKKILNNHI